MSVSLSETSSTPDAPVKPTMLLASQLIFNLGFYMVLPFLAMHLRDNLSMAGAMVALVLGVRTFFYGGGW